VVVVVVVVAALLTVVGVVSAVRDANPGGGPGRDPLVLHGQIPTSVGLSFSLTTNGRTSASGTLDINFAKKSLSGQVQIPLVVTTATFSLRGIDRHLFINNVNLNAASHETWYRVPLSIPSLYLVALEFSHPDVGFIRSFAKTYSTHQGFATTYHFENTGVSLTSLTPQKGRALPGKEVLTITTGAEDEATAASATVSTPVSTTALSVRVLWYNHPVVVTAPPKSQWAAVPQSLAKDLLGTQILQGVTLPQNLLQEIRKLTSA
jgi:hypothetical protein